MNPSDRERRDRRQQLRRARWKVDQRQLPAGEYDDADCPRGEREWHVIVCARRQANPADEGAWQAAVARFEETLAQLNRKIDDFNLVVPISSCQRVRLRLADELRRVRDE